MLEEVEQRVGEFAGGDSSRAALLNLLFRETDRAQRMKSPLSLILIAVGEIDGRRKFSREDLLNEVLGRISRLLRSYDVLGRLDDDKLFVLLPGCGPSGAAMLCERLQAGIFANRYTFGIEPIRLSACLGITSSMGRSPVIVLREAAQALRDARASGPGSIAWFPPPRSRNL